MRKTWRLTTLSLLMSASLSLAQSTTLGVISLNSNTPNPEAAWISRGLADMLTTDLSKISKLTVVQREQLDKVLKEQALGASGAVDPARAAQLGKVLGAQTLLTGSYAAIGRNVRVDLQLINSATGKVESGVTAEGSIDSIFTLEKQLVLAILGKLGIAPSAAEMQAILQPETFNNQAVILNYQALTQLQSNPTAATATLQQALALDPNYASAQQNLRIALNVTGQSLANAAILDLEIKGKEIDAARQVAVLLRDSMQITNLKFGDIRTDSQSGASSDSGSATIEYTFEYGLRPGTLKSVAKLLSPFSREGGDRVLWTLNAPGIGRGDTVKLYLNRQSVSFIEEYLNFFDLYVAFYGTGKFPIYVAKTRLNHLASTVISSRYTKEESSSSDGSIEAPISLVRNLLGAEGKVAHAEPYGNTVSAEEPYLYLDSKNAREIKVPAGYIREFTSKPYDCKVTENGSGPVDFKVSNIKSVDKIDSFSGDCTIYTKINDGDFNPKKLRELTESGEDYSITYFNTKEQKFTTRKRNSLFRSADYDLNMAGQKFDETITVIDLSRSYFEFGRYKWPMANPNLNVVTIRSPF